MINQWLELKNELKQALIVANEKHDLFGYSAYTVALNKIKEIETKFELQSLAEAGYGV